MLVTSSELLRRSARLFVEEGGSADNLVLGIQEGGPAGDDDHPQRASEERLWWAVSPAGHRVFFAVVL